MDRREISKEDRRGRSSRRYFIKTSVVGGLAAALTAGRGLASVQQADPAAAPEAEQDTAPSRDHTINEAPQEHGRKEAPRIRRYRTLGRTGWKVSDISSGDPNDMGVLGYLLDCGVNYFDTAESYRGGRGERMFGEALGGRSRKSVFITTKLEIGSNRSKDHLIGRMRKCLERLRSDYVDCMMIHMPPNVNDLLTPGFHEAIAEMKREGRVRFCGVSHHGSYYDDTIREPMQRVMLAAIEDGRFDLILPVYNFLNEHDGDRILTEASKKGVGTIVMKSNPVGHYYDFKTKVESLQKKSGERYEYYSRMMEKANEKAELAKRFIANHGLDNPDAVRDAAIRYVISNENVGTVILTFRTFGDVERFVGLSGTVLEDGDRGMLDDYREHFGDLYCRHACGRCEPSCPHGVPVNTIMRYHHYFDAQGREKEAMTEYARLPAQRADLCRNCEGWCERACPYGVPIKGLLCISHETLTLA
jgi:predicted aldo/keto reductase-like oxidoreductase